MGQKVGEIGFELVPKFGPELAAEKVLDAGSARTLPTPRVTQRGSCPLVGTVIPLVTALKSASLANMTRRWTETEWDYLFATHPPMRSSRPTESDCEAVALWLDRTPGAVLWMWQDAEAHLRGASSYASLRLMAYLDRRRRSTDPTVSPEAAAPSRT